MYNKTPVLIGLLLFLGLATLPFWMNFGAEQALPEPVVIQTTDASGAALQCVESAEWMRANHMQLLDDWRHEVVREGKRTYVNSQGVKFDKSLTKTCLECHSNKEQFCENCHKAVSTVPYCWTCHLVPGDFAQSAGNSSTDAIRDALVLAAIPAVNTDSPANPVKLSRERVRNE